MPARDCNAGAHKGAATNPTCVPGGCGRVKSTAKARVSSGGMLAMATRGLIERERDAGPCVFTGAGRAIAFMGIKQASRETGHKSRLGRSAPRTPYNLTFVSI